MLNFQQFNLLCLNGWDAIFNLLARTFQLSFLKFPLFLSLFLHHLRPLSRLLANEFLHVAIINKRTFTVESKILFFFFFGFFFCFFVFFFCSFFMIKGGERKARSTKLHHNVNFAVNSLFSFCQLLDSGTVILLHRLPIF
jgi:hypothetical protein